MFHGSLGTAPQVNLPNIKLILLINQLLKLNPIIIKGGPTSDPRETVRHLGKVRFEDTHSQAKTFKKNTLAPKPMVRCCAPA